MTKKLSVKFGTSGHRGIIGDSFTKDHVIAIVMAIANYLTTVKNISSPCVLLGYDTRAGNSPMLNDTSYTHAILSVLQSKKIDVDFCDSYTATPVVSWAVKNHTYDLGIMLTASHNPPNYNGIKINDENGAPADVDITNWIEVEANSILEKNDGFDQFKLKLDDVKRVTFTGPFTNYLIDFVKTIFNFEDLNLDQPFIIDAKCGCAISVWKEIMADNNKIEWLNDNFSSEFNAQTPDPTSEESLRGLGKMCKKKGCVAWSNDPDADRHVMIDERGNYISPEKITAIIIYYCKLNNIDIDSVASTLANSYLIKVVCDEYNIAFCETKIGFKYVTKALLTAEKLNKICIGVESSGGLSISGHTLDKCGFFPILAILGIMKKRSMTLVELSKNIDDEFGEYHFVESSISVNNNVITAMMGLNQSDVVAVFMQKIQSINKDDGLKIIFENGDWVLCRPSGTEPLIRIYAESKRLSTAKKYSENIKLFWNHLK